MGSVIGSSSTHAFADDPFKNKVNIDTDAKQKKNDCDTDVSGTSSEGYRRIDRPLIFFIFSMQLCDSKYYSHQIVGVYLYFKVHKVLV